MGIEQLNDAAVKALYAHFLYSVKDIHGNYNELTDEEKKIIPENVFNYLINLYMFEELERTSVRSLLNELNESSPGQFDCLDCSSEVREKLNKLDPNTMIIVFGRYRHARLEGDHPTFYIHSVVEYTD